MKVRRVHVDYGVKFAEFFIEAGNVGDQMVGLDPADGYIAFRSIHGIEYFFNWDKVTSFSLQAPEEI